MRRMPGWLGKLSLRFGWLFAAVLGMGGGKCRFLGCAALARCFARDDSLFLFALLGSGRPYFLRRFFFWGAGVGRMGFLLRELWGRGLCLT